MVGCSCAWLHRDAPLGTSQAKHPSMGGQHQNTPPRWVVTVELGLAGVTKQNKTKLANRQIEQGLSVRRGESRANSSFP